MTSTERASAQGALITGGASGIGLFVAKHLVEQGWNVMIVDYNEESGKKAARDLGEEKVLFTRADVSDYDQQASAFGILDRTNMYEPAKEREDGAPVKPDTSVIDICLTGVVYSAYLAVHYFRKNPGGIGKLVSTASMGGLYPSLQLPMYTAAKHGVVGITRTLAQTLAAKGEHMTVNCICPGAVDTGISGVLVTDAMRKLMTPLSTVVRAVDGFLADPSKNGLVAECSINNIHYREQPEWSDEEARKVMTSTFYASGPATN
ncbi:hypothetical protein COCMIDRAFT_1647 [Bipolaris oryzae ATCC 44560]|uniref:Uncharacterized protein n=1 Tax=Bipolaris oryzae ATCC 44560 TaxID=930090 RepID=W7A0N3_COCMI|nr:uncharacterized protein COCMIDRAFT_1647 [Bipolaris oryzae ATCC 44560]EUC49606.1 hypothetical protein COCMIDRAFT_1647 [Bipolaris oryzae ATCC 44560]